MVFDLLFRLGPAIQAVFSMGYEPKERFFYELTQEQYRELEAHGKDLTQRWYALIPMNPRHDVSDLLVVSEEEKTALLDATAQIHRLCQDKLPTGDLAEFEDKLKYLAGILPEAFTHATPYEKAASRAKLSVVK